MLASISHELKTPLNSSISNLQQLILNKEIPMQLKENYVNPALFNNHILKNIVYDILDLASIDKGMVQLNYDIFNLKELIEDCLKYIKLQTDLKNIQTRLEYSDNLQLNFYNDPIRIQQIMLNMLMNAEKFTNQGEITIKAELRDKKYAYIQVIDTGIGMDD